MMDSSDVRKVAIDLIAPIVAERRIILTGSAAGSSHMANFLADAGAHPVSVPIRAAGNTRAQFMTYERALASPPSSLVRAMDVADPAHCALIYAGSFTAVRDIAGRRVIGSRTPAQQAAERKDTQDQLLRLETQILPIAAGLPRSADAVVAQGIPTSGLAMGASHTYLIPRAPAPRQLYRVTKRLGRDCDQILIRPFDPGTPCTFYGFVTDDAVIDLGPVEALVYWDPRRWRIHTPGVMRPLQLDADSLTTARTEIHALVSNLRDRTGYLGAFGTDGVISHNRYTVHEINPRVCAGFSLLNDLIPAAAPLAAVDLALRECGTVASQPLAGALAQAAQSLMRNTTVAVRLWNRGNEPRNIPSASSTWRQSVRRRVGGTRRIAIAEL